MDAKERDFLLAEFSTAWSMIIALDDRRMKFVEFHAGLATLILAGASALVTWRKEVDVAVAIPLSGMLAVGVVATYAVRRMLHAERKANVRYRNKINLIRQTFLATSADPSIKAYLTRSEFGIRTDEIAAKDKGSTLNGVLVFLYVEAFLMLLAIPGVWYAALSQQPK